MPDNPFAEVEKLLAKPGATGVFITRLSPHAPVHAAKLRVGDIITHAGGVLLGALKDFYTAMQPKGKEDATRALTLWRDGETLEIEIPAGLRNIGFGFCFVKRDVAAWDARPESDYKPDFSVLRKGGEIWLRNSLGGDLAGFELLRIRPEGDFIDVETLFRLGGGDKPEETWDYRTRGVSRHKLDKHLSVVRTAFWEGAPKEEKLKGDVELRDGQWRGVHVTAEGERKVEFGPASPHVLTAYTVTLLPMTMPLSAGVSAVFFHSNDGIAVANGRERIECLGRKETVYLGNKVKAWCFAWRHYGAPSDTEDEKFWLDDERRMIRIDWGPRYGDCWCELVAGPGELKGLPAHVKVE